MEEKYTPRSKGAVEQEQLRAFATVGKSKQHLNNPHFLFLTDNKLRGTVRRGKVGKPTKSTKGELNSFY